MQLTLCLGGQRRPAKTLTVLGIDHPQAVNLPSQIPLQNSEFHVLNVLDVLPLDPFEGCFQDLQDLQDID